jgi:hypothetical protein
MNVRIKEMRAELKEWSKGLHGAEYCQGLVSIGTKYVKWLSLFEGSRPMLFDIADFYEVALGPKSLDTLIGEVNRYKM